MLYLGPRLGGSMSGSDQLAIELHRGIYLDKEKPLLSGLHQVIECPTIRMRMGQGRFGMKPEWICGKVEPMAACVVPSFWFRPISTLEMNHPDLESTSRSSTQGQRPNSFSR
ncbi:hypothetical protein ACOSP7_012919 [Xanthoceras sorbifolium]